MNSSAGASSARAGDPRLLPILMMWMTLVLGLVMLYLQTQTPLGGAAAASERSAQPAPSAPPSEQPAPSEQPSEQPAPSAPPSTQPAASEVDEAALAGKPGEDDDVVARRSCSALAPLIPVITGQTGVQDASDPALTTALAGVAAVGRVSAGGGEETRAVREAATALAEGAQVALSSQEPVVQQEGIQRATVGLNTIKANCRRLG